MNTTNDAFLLRLWFLHVVCHLVAAAGIAEVVALVLVFWLTAHNGQVTRVSPLPGKLLQLRL